jgi:hypothetical protein
VLALLFDQHLHIHKQLLEFLKQAISFSEHAHPNYSYNYSQAAYNDGLFNLLHVIVTVLNFCQNSSGLTRTLLLHELHTQLQIKSQLLMPYAQCTSLADPSYRLCKDGRLFVSINHILNLFLSSIWLD